MRVTRWLLGCVTVLLVAAFAAAWLVPPHLDGDRFRAPLQGLASRVLGAAVRIQGPLHLRLLPQPELESGPIDIARSAPGDARLSAGGLRLELALGPLLAGRIEARTLVLQQPDLVLPALVTPRVLLARRPAWLGGVSARIESGTIETGDVILRGVDATLAVDPLSGDLAVSGNASLTGNAWGFSARVTRPGGDGAAGIDVSLNGQAMLDGTAMTLSGQLQSDGGLQGNVATHGPDLSRLLPAPSLPFRAEGRISVAAGLAAADDLAVELGGSPSRGAVALRFAPSWRLDLALAASRLELDPWLATLRLGGQSGKVLGGIPLGIDLSAEAATLGGGTLRGVRAAFDVTPGRLDVRELRVVLPGEANLRFTGKSAAGHLDGDARLTAPALRTTLDWLAGLLPQSRAWPAGLPAQVLHAADVSAHVTAGADGITLSRLAGTLDGGRIAGGVGWRSGVDGTAPKLAAVLSLQRLDLDPYLERGAEGADLDLHLDIRTATLRGLTLAPFQLDLLRGAGAIQVPRVQAKLGGVTASGHGKLSAAGRSDDMTLVLDAGRLSMVTALNLPALPLAWAAGTKLADEKLHVTLDASGTRQALSTRLLARLDSMEIEAEPLLDLNSLHWSGPLSVRHPGARQLLEATGVLPRLALPPRAGWLGEGSLAMAADCTGEPGLLVLDHFDLTAGSLRARSTLRLSWKDAPSLSGQIDAETLPLPGLARDSLDAMLSGGAPAWQVVLQVAAKHLLVGGAEAFAPLAADLAVSGGRARLDDFSAGLAGGGVQGQALLDMSAEPPLLEALGSLRNAIVSAPLIGMPVDVAAGRLTAQASIAAAGHSTAAMLSTLHGFASGTVTQGRLDGVSLADLPADLPQAQVEGALAGGRSQFSRAEFAAGIEHGIAALTRGEITLADGVAGISGVYDIGQDQADLLLGFRPTLAAKADPSPVIGLRLVGPRDHVQRIPQLAALARWRAAREQ